MIERFRAGLARYAVFGLEKVVILYLSLLLAGCSSLMSSVTSKMAADLGASILDSDDPKTVEQGVPAYLLMVDSFLRSSPDNPDLLMAAAGLNGSFVLFTDEERARLLSNKSLDYASRAACLEIAAICNPGGIPYEQFVEQVGRLKEKNLSIIYSLAVAWIGWIQANSGDWNAIAQLNRARVLMEKVIELDPAHEGGNAQLYMGGLETLLPASMGGNPEKGRQHFEQAIKMSGGKNQMARVVYARQYARLVFDKALHDKLLKEAIDADPRVEGLTLINTLAQEQAKILLAESDDYF